MEPGIIKARQAELRARLHQYRGTSELSAVLEVIALFKVEHDKTLHVSDGVDVPRAQGGWIALDRLETWIKTPTPVSND
jgi:hypothetical protein